MVRGVTTMLLLIQGIAASVTGQRLQDGSRNLLAASLTIEPTSTVSPNFVAPTTLPTSVTPVVARMTITNAPAAGNYSAAANNTARASNTAAANTTEKAAAAPRAPGAPGSPGAPGAPAGTVNTLNVTKAGTHNVKTAGAPGAPSAPGAPGAPGLAGAPGKPGMAARPTAKPTASKTVATGAGAAGTPGAPGRRLLAASPLPERNTDMKPTPRAGSVRTLNTTETGTPAGNKTETAKKATAATVPSHTTGVKPMVSNHTVVGNGTGGGNKMAMPAATGNKTANSTNRLYVATAAWALGRRLSSMLLRVGPSPTKATVPKPALAGGRGQLGLAPQAGSVRIANASTTTLTAKPAGNKTETAKKTVVSTVPSHTMGVKPMANQTVAASGTGSANKSAATATGNMTTNATTRMAVLAAPIPGSGVNAFGRPIPAIVPGGRRLLAAMASPSPTWPAKSPGAGTAPAPPAICHPLPGSGVPCAVPRNATTG